MVDVLLRVLAWEVVAWVGVSFVYGIYRLALVAITDRRSKHEVSLGLMMIGGGIAIAAQMSPIS